MNGVALHFINSTTGFCVSNNGSIFKTTNAGDNWFIISNILESDYYHGNIMFVNENTGYISSRRVNSGVFKTTNGGYNWTAQNVTNYYGMNYLYFINPDTGFVGGGDGLIYKTTTGGEEFKIIKVVPDKYSLSQNYPNPFNPTTKIKYDLPKNSLVKLVVFDAIGREMAVIVNEHQSAGTYEATFNASQYPSGVYFYRLTTEDFSETKKMLLVR